MSQSKPPVYNGRYELSHLIARGGTAQVYLARDLLLDRPVALKVLFPELSADHSFVERFRREAQAAANLSHPHIVPVFDWGESESTYFIVMEYVAGEPLSAIIRSEGPMPPVRAACIASDIASALSYAHRSGVVHRDIKPGNVLITNDGQVKVTDFGIARAIGTDDNVTQTGLVMGTATYFSPEQAQGLGVDGRSDVYALGVVLYEMVTRRPPFAGDTPVAIAYQHVSEQPKPPHEIEPSVPPGLEAIILQAMAKAPADRYASAQDFQADLDRFVHGNAVLANPTARTEALNAGDLTTRALSPDDTAVITRQGGGPGGVTGETVLAPRLPRRSTPWWIGAGLALLCGIGALVYFGGRGLGYFGGPAYVHVPDVTGHTLAKAESILRSQHLKYRKEAQSSKTAAKNTLLGQDPKPATTLRQGQFVTLLVSSGPPIVSVPTVVGLTLKQAETKLQAAGFTVKAKGQAGLARPGTVTRQNPAHSARYGSLVTLDYVNGLPNVLVPNVAGKSVGGAGSVLGKDGFSYGGIIRPGVLSTTVKVGYVVATSPPIGDSVPEGTSVKLIISLGPGVQVPQLIGNTPLVAIVALQSEGLGYIEMFGTPPNPQLGGLVYDQTPPEGTVEPTGYKVTIFVGRQTTTTTLTPTGPTFPPTGAPTTVPATVPPTTAPFGPSGTTGPATTVPTT